MQQRKKLAAKIWHRLKDVRTYQRIGVRSKQLAIRFARWVVTFSKTNWRGALVIAAFTIFFFWPIIIRINSYIEGGDAMFNAWTLSRNYHCLTFDGCPNYADGNIYFPNKDSMLYSESQLSAGLVTLPLYFLNDNPIFTYNFWTIASFFLAGFFMYLLAKYLSKGKEFLPIIAGLAFAYAPIKMSSIWHLQNLSIFYLPLIMLLTFKFFDARQRKYLALLFVAMVLQFYASWYQMVFVLMALGVVVGGAKLFRIINWRQLLVTSSVVALAAFATLPLALQYVRFSKENNASFGVREQLLYESSLSDYWIPHDGTLLGKLYYALKPGTQVDAFNLDSFSYHGMILYAVLAVLLVIVWRRRRRSISDRRALALVVTLIGVGFVGFVVSLGPLLKLGSHFIYGNHPDVPVTIPLPWLAIDKLLPQLEFIRGLGRASILVLFMLCCSLGYFASYIDKVRLFARYKWWVYGTIAAFAIFELMPFHQVPMSSLPNNYNLSVPAVYRYIRAHDDIDDIVTVEADSDYPGAPIPEIRAEWVLWAGYSNRNTFNGYSGYEPKTYMADYVLFKTMTPAAVARMKELGLRYVIVDKQLSTTDPAIAQRAEQLFSQKIYEDARYSLFKI